LRVLADIDMLTQLPNRRHFEDIAAQNLRVSARGSSSLMRLDIDHFKQINERYGHAAGDEALKLVAGSARKMLRNRDLLGRLGGDEFIILLPDTSVQDALHVADRMARHIDTERRSQRQPALSLSFGVVQMLSEEALTTATQRAEEAMHEAKRQGRNRAVAAEEHSADPDGRTGEPVFTSSRPMGA